MKVGDLVRWKYSNAVGIVVAIDGHMIHICEAQSGNIKQAYFTNLDVVTGGYFENERWN